MSNRRRLSHAAGSALTLAALLSGCDDRLDGRQQPNPFAGEAQSPAAIAPRQAAAPDETGSGASPAEVVYVDPDTAEDEDWLEDSPASAEGFDPMPMDPGRGFDPSPDGSGGWADDESE